MSDERRVIEPVDAATDNIGEYLSLPDGLHRVLPWMPEPPPGVDLIKWPLVVDKLEAAHSVLEEASQEHLRPESVIGLLTEVCVLSRKLGVELESVMAAMQKTTKKKK